MKIYVWGTGNYAEYFLKTTNCIDEIEGFIGNSEPGEEFKNRYMQGKKLYKSSELKNVEYDLLIIAVLTGSIQEEICQECLKLHLDMNKIVVVDKVFDLHQLTPSEKFVNNLFKKNYMFINMFCDFIPFWRAYYYKHLDSISEKMEILESGLDDQSKVVAEILAERNFKIIPLPEYQKMLLWDIEKYMTQDEKKLLADTAGWEDSTRNRYSLPKNLPLEISVFYFDCGLKFLPENVLSSLHGRDFIDGGAYWGDSALVLNRYSPSSIHCFEPMDSNFEYLKNTISSRGLHHIVPVKLGLGTVSESTEYFYAPLDVNNLGPYSMGSCLTLTVASETQRSSTISVTSIDTYADNLQLNIGLIKLDVEGNELATIRGALNTIKRCRPVLLISIYHTPDDFFEIKPLLESLSMDYHFMIRHLTYGPNTEIMLIAY